MKKIKKQKPKLKFHIGIDEAGRGPLAGPVAVGVFIALRPEFRRHFRGVRESKQLSEEQREIWFAKIEQAKRDGLIDFAVGFQTAKQIDARGLTHTINKAMEGALKTILKDRLAENGINDGADFDDCRIELDGGLRAPAHFKNQKTIIKGDEKRQIIALASICAKVLRDRRMRAFAETYPHYGFEIHKGYGTRAHYAALRKHGMTPIHRRLFLRKFQNSF